MTFFDKTRNLRKLINEKNLITLDLLSRPTKLKANLHKTSHIKNSMDTLLLRKQAITKPRKKKKEKTQSRQR